MNCTIRRSWNRKVLGQMKAANLTIAMVVARKKFGHNVCVSTTAYAAKVDHTKPDPLPEVEYFGVGFYGQSANHLTRPARVA